MNIGFISIFILVILLCIPVYLIYFFKLNLQHIELEQHYIQLTSCGVVGLIDRLCDDK